MPNIVTIFIGLGVVVLLIIMTSIAKMFRKAGPNEAIIVYGFRGPRIIGPRRRHLSRGRELHASSRSN